jgi:hypothetical protein
VTPEEWAEEVSMIYAGNPCASEKVNLVVAILFEKAIREAQEAARGDERDACIGICKKVEEQQRAKAAMCPDDSVGHSRRIMYTDEADGAQYCAAEILARGESTPEPQPLERRPMTWAEFDKDRMVAEVRRSEKLSGEDMMTRVGSESPPEPARCQGDAGDCGHMEHPATPERQEPVLKCQFIVTWADLGEGMEPIRCRKAQPCSDGHPSSSTPSEGK